MLLDLVQPQSGLKYEYVEKWKKYDYTIDINGGVYSDPGNLDHADLAYRELTPDENAEVVFVHPFANYLTEPGPYFDLWLGNWIFPFYHLLSSHGYEVALSSDFVSDKINVAPVRLMRFLSEGALERLKSECKPVFCCSELSATAKDSEGIYYIKQNPATVSTIRDMSFYLFEQDLKPRDSQREDRLKTIAYLGCENNLHKELKSDRFSKFLEDLDVEFRICGADNATGWGNYRDVDLVLAIRPDLRSRYRQKPASKLVNCWRAGVPLLAAHESAYTDLGRNRHDVLLVRTISGARKVIRRLTDPRKYERIRRGVRRRQVQYSDERIAADYFRKLVELVSCGSKNGSGAPPAV